MKTRNAKSLSLKLSSTKSNLTWKIAERSSWENWELTKSKKSSNFKWIKRLSARMNWRKNEWTKSWSKWLQKMKWRWRTLAENLPTFMTRRSSGTKNSRGEVSRSSMMQIMKNRCIAENALRLKPLSMRRMKELDKRESWKAGLLMKKSNNNVMNFLENVTHISKYQHVLLTKIK